MAFNRLKSNTWRRRLPFLLLALVGLYVLLPQLGDFRASTTLALQARPLYVCLAAIAILMTFPAAAGTVSFLAIKRLRYGETMLVQMAANFANHILPAGIGALGANYAYLRRCRHSKAEAVAVMAVNNFLGVLGHLLIVALAVVTMGYGINPWRHASLGSGDWWLAGGIAAALFVLFLFAGPRFKAVLTGAGRKVMKQLSRYRLRPGNLLSALLISMSLTACNVASLWCCLKALDGHLPLVAILIVYSLGVGLGTITPTPGGLGGVEAALVAGFVAYGLTGADALAAALLYRLISYWLPLLLGAAAFAVCEQRGLFTARY